MAPRTKKTKEESSLLRALRFIQLAQAEQGTPYQTHCRLFRQVAVAFNGVLAAGHPIEEDLHLCPHTYKLIAALEKVGGAYQFVAYDNGQVSVKTDKFKVLMDTLSPDGMTFIQPDPADWPITSAFKDAAVKAGLFSTDGAQTVMAASIVTRNQSVIGSNGSAIVEAWHGCNMPPNLVIPKSFVSAIAKVDKPLVRFGFTEATLTFHYEDQSWIKTQLYQEAYPNVDRVLEGTLNARPVPLPKHLFEAIDAVLPFTDGSAVIFGNGLVRSHKTDEVGASHQCKEVVDELVLNAKYLNTLRPYIEQIDLAGTKEAVFFFGPQMRGVLAKMV